MEKDLVKNMVELAIEHCADVEMTLYNLKAKNGCLYDVKVKVEVLDIQK